MEDAFAQGGGAQVGRDEIELLVKLGPGRAMMEEVLLRKIAAEMARKRGLK